MDTRIDPGMVAVDRGRKMGVAGGRHCATCGVIVHWRVEKFCLSQRLRFGGRIYCMGCQKAFPAG
jgi:hypothetical protein